MKKFFSLVLAFLLTLSTLTGCVDTHFRFKDDTSLTRGQWIEQLAATFGMDDFEKDEAYFSDVPATDSIYTAAQSCYEWNVLRDIGKKLKKNDGASLEFAVSTAIYATGVDLSNEVGKNDCEKAINYAVENGIIPSGLNYSKWVTAEQSQELLSAAQLAYLNQSFTPVDNVKFLDTVSDQRNSNELTAINEGEYLIRNRKPNVGDVLIAPGTPENPDGVAIKITDITDNGDGTYTVKTCTPELYEVFDEVEYAGVAIPKFEDIIPADGVQITQGSTVSPVSYQSDADMSYKTMALNYTSTDKPVVATLGSLSNDSDIIPLGIGDSKETALSFTATCNFTKGTVSINPAWSNASLNIEQLITGNHLGGVSSREDSDKYHKDSANSPGEWFSKKSVFPDRKVFGADPYGNDEAIEAYKKGVITADELREALYGTSKTDSNYVRDPDKPYVNSQEGHENIPNITNKFSGGYEIIGSVSIKDLYFVPKYKLKTAKVFGVDTGIPTGIESFSLETNYGVSASLSVKGKLENELTVCSIPISLGGVGTLKVDIVIYAELNGEISVKASINNNTKTEYASGKTKKTSTQTSSASAEANLEFETGPKISAKLYLCAVPLINAGVSAAVKVKSSGAIKYSTDWTETDENFVVNRKTTMSYNLDLFVPIVKISIGTDKSTLANKLNLKFTWTLCGAEGSNAPLKAAEFNLIDDEIVVWKDSQTLPKNEDKEESSSGDSQSSSQSPGGNMQISSYYINLMPGEETAIELDYPNGYGADDFKWSTSDKNVVTVKNGKLVAKKSGSAIVKAESKDGKYYANCAVYVGENKKEQ